MESELVSYAKDVSVEAGELLLKMFERRLEIVSKEKGVKDIVTEADTMAEDLIKSRLQENYPDVPVISEESDIDKEHSGFDSGNFWVIDPLDGTRNFTIGNPNFVVSVGYVDGGMGFHGAVYYPVLDQLFYTEKGCAYLEGDILRINTGVDLDDAIVAFWDKREKDPNWDAPDVLNSLRGKVKVLRMFGASVLEKSWVAGGQVDLYIGNSSSIFGAVAGVALVRNAGGIALNLKGEEWKLGDIGIICGEEDLFNQALMYLI